MYFAYPSYSDYFIGRGDYILSITDAETPNTVTLLGDSTLASSAAS